MQLQADARADLFASLADPMRRRIVELLRGHEKPVNDIVAELDIHQSGVSRHLRILNDAGFVSVRADGPRRLYALRAEPFRELDAWIGRYRDLWEARLDRLGAELERRKAGKKAGTNAAATGATGASRGRNKEKGT
jgi:DNA-binding transcriptional ArsR family regulator